MRKPEQPPDWTLIVSRRSKEFVAAQGDAKYLAMSRKCEAGYWPWQKLRFRVQTKNLDPEIVWAMAKVSRTTRYRMLPLRGDDGAPLQFNNPDILQHELMLIDQQLAGGLTSGDDAAPSAAQREQFIINAFQEEAIASSMLEGAVTTRQDAKQMLKTGRRPRDRGEQMVLNNYDAIQFVREHRKGDLSADFLLELQKILTAKTLDDSSQVGRFRTAEDHIDIIDQRDNEVMHKPPPASELPERLKALCDFANRPHEGRDFIHPVISACVLHFQIGFDHPFCDGNGRTGRALFYWMMLRSGYWLFEYLPISRLIYRAPAKYARAFLYCETDEFDVTYFFLYKARIIERARQDLKKYISEKQKQIVQAKLLFSSDGRLNHRQREIVLQAARNPHRFFTIAEHQGQNGVTYATARSDILDLVQWKYLKKLQSGRRFEFSAGEKVSEIEPENA